MSHARVFLLFLSVWMVWKVRIVESGDWDSARKNVDHVVSRDFLNAGGMIDADDKRRGGSSLHAVIPDVSRYAGLNARIENPACRRDADILLDKIKHLDMWALKMLDSSGRMSSGLLNGNVNQLGDFDQCLSVDSEADSWDSDVDSRDADKTNRSVETAITGKYCLAFLDVKIVNNSHMDQLLHSYGAFVSNLSDPGHRVARFSGVSWGVCLPDSCSAGDLQLWLTQLWADNSGVQVQVQVQPDMCYTNHSEPLSAAKAATYVLFGAVLLMAVLGSCMEEDADSAGSQVSVSRIVRAFSLRRNLRALFATSSPPDDVPCLHGVRALSALCLVIFHKSAAVMFNPYANRTAMAKSLGLAWSVIGRTAIIYTDSFIFLSGLLTSYIFIKDLDKKGRIGVKDKYWTRFFRIVPNLAAVILFCTYVMVDLGSGPQWNLVVKHHSDLCKVNMWRNLLFIHNYFGFENMCLTHTHQLGIDMQLYVAAPLVVWLLWRHTKVGMLAVVSLAALSTALRYTVALDKQLSPVLYFGATVSQMFATANLSYILPSHRATVYLMGIAVGYMLRRVKSLTLNKFQVTVMYLLGLGLGAYAMLGPYEMARKGYVYSALDAAKWNAFAPIMWSAMICLCIVLCTYGYGGFLNDILSWKGFLVFTRMAYGVYLTQFPVFFYNVGSQRTPETYSPRMLFDFAEVGAIMLASIALTILIDLPFQTIKKMSWKSTTAKYLEARSEERVDSASSGAEVTTGHVVKPRGNGDVTQRIIHGARTG